jgi:uncharacterized membrane protein YqjE
MSVPEGIGSGASPGLFVSLRSFWSVLVAILYTRLDLATAELEDEAIRGLKLIAAGLVSLLCLFMAYFFAMFFIIALAWGTPYQFWVIGAIFAIYFGAGIGLFFLARHMILSRPKFLSQTLAELRRDVEGLRRAAAAKKDEANP